MATNHLSVMIEAIGHEPAMKVKEALRVAGYVIYKETTPPKVLTKEEARRTHPSNLEMQWHRFSDRGPPDWEGYTYMGPQNYGNQFDPEQCLLLWVRPKRD